MANVLDKINKLIALAGSPDEPEARSAAWAAVKLIREHKIQMSLPSTQKQYPFDGMPTSGRRDYPFDGVPSSFKEAFGVDFADMWESIKEAEKPPRYKPPPPRYEPPTRPTPPPPPPSRPKRRRSVKEPVSMESKVGGNCKKCKKPIAIGSLILWARGAGATHHACGSYWDEEIDA